MRVVRRVVALAGVIALVAGCGGEGSGSGSKGGGGRLSIATGGTSGVYFVYGGGLAKVISSNLEGYRATAETTSASVDNLILIQKGSSDIAFTLGDTALDAVAGRESFMRRSTCGRSRRSTTTTPRSLPRRALRSRRSTT